MSYEPRQKRYTFEIVACDSDCEEIASSSDGFETDSDDFQNPELLDKINKVQDSYPDNSIYVSLRRNTPNRLGVHLQTILYTRD